jgi:hypothetical protein
MQHHLRMQHPLTNNSKSHDYPTGCVAQLRAFVPSCDKIELPKSFPFALSALSASLRDKFFPANPTAFSPLPTFFFISPPFFAFSLYSFVLFCVLSWLNPNP